MSRQDTYDLSAIIDNLGKHDEPQEWLEIANKLRSHRHEWLDNYMRQYRADIKASKEAGMTVKEWRERNENH